MIATNQLRWVKRTLNYNPTTGQMLGYYADVLILQQKWVEVRSSDMHWLTPPAEEWRDVPVEEETK